MGIYHECPAEVGIALRERGQVFPVGFLLLSVNVCFLGEWVEWAGWAGGRILL